MNEYQLPVPIIVQNILTLQRKVLESRPPTLPTAAVTRPTARYTSRRCRARSCRPHHPHAGTGGSPWGVSLALFTSHRNKARRCTPAPGYTWQPAIREEGHFFPALIVPVAWRVESVGRVP